MRRRNLAAFGLGGAVISATILLSGDRGTWWREELDAQRGRLPQGSDGHLTLQLPKPFPGDNPRSTPAPLPEAVAPKSAQERAGEGQPAAPLAVGPRPAAAPGDEHPDRHLAGQHNAAVPPVAGTVNVSKPGSHLAGRGSERPLPVNRLAPVQTRPAAAAPAERLTATSGKASQGVARTSQASLAKPAPVLAQARVVSKPAKPAAAPGQGKPRVQDWQLGEPSLVAPAVHPAGEPRLAAGKPGPAVKPTRTAPAEKPALARPKPMVVPPSPDYRVTTADRNPAPRLTVPPATRQPSPKPSPTTVRTPVPASPTPTLAQTRPAVTRSAATTAPAPKPVAPSPSAPQLAAASTVRTPAPAGSGELLPLDLAARKPVAPAPAASGSPVRKKRDFSAALLPFETESEAVQLGHTPAEKSPSPASMAQLQAALPKRQPPALAAATRAPASALTVTTGPASPASPPAPPAAPAAAAPAPVTFPVMSRSFAEMLDRSARTPLARSGSIRLLRSEAFVDRNALAAMDLATSPPVQPASPQPAPPAAPAPRLALPTPAPRPAALGAQSVVPQTAPPQALSPQAPSPQAAPPAVTPSAAPKPATTELASLAPATPRVSPAYTAAPQQPAVQSEPQAFTSLPQDRPLADMASGRLRAPDAPASGSGLAQTPSGRPLADLSGGSLGQGLAPASSSALSQLPQVLAEGLERAARISLARPGIGWLLNPVAFVDKDAIDAMNLATAAQARERKQGGQSGQRKASENGPAQPPVEKLAPPSGPTPGTAPSSVTSWPDASLGNVASAVTAREPLIGLAQASAPAPKANPLPSPAPANDNLGGKPGPADAGRAALIPALATKVSTPAGPPPPSLASLVPSRVMPGAVQAGLFTQTSAASAGGLGAMAGFSDNDELILEIETAQHEMSDTLIAYNQRGKVYLPLGAIARFLDLAITVSDEGRYATGWAIDPAQTLSINLREGKLLVAGREVPLALGDALPYDGEMYLRTERFADLLPLTLAVNLRAQMVTVKPLAPFPYQQRLAREQERERLANRKGQGGKRWPREATTWLGLSVPLADIETRLVSDDARGTRAEGDLRLSGDLAWLTAKAYVSGTSDDGLTSAHIEMGRRSPDGSLLGPFQATAFGVGDVSSVPMAMGLGATAGRGLFVSNAPLETASVFDTIELRGDLPDGYEVELYRNNILLDSSRTPVNGQYQFLNVPVEFGLNVFRLVFYGPQGQRREVVRQISVGDGRLAKGQVVYGVSAVQKNKAVFDLHPRNWLAGDDDGSFRGAGQVQYGLSKDITLAVGSAWYERRGQEHWLTTAGLRSGFGGMAVKMDLGLADHNGKALSFGLATKLAGFSMTLNHAEYRGSFVDEVRSYSDTELRRTSEFSLNGTLNIGGGDKGLHIPVYGFGRLIEFADGRRVQTAALHQSLPLARSLQMSNNFEYSRSSAPGVVSTSRLVGTADLSTLSRSATQYRAIVDYDLLPQLRLTAVSGEVDHRLGDSGMVRASLGRNLVTDQTQVGASAMRRFGSFSLGLDGNYSTNPGQYSVSLRLGFSLGRNPYSGRFFTAQSGLASGGAAAVRAFRDRDGDGRFSTGDEPLADVQFFSGTEHVATDARGVALLGRLGDGPRNSVQIDNETLPDVALAPVTGGVELTPRAGRIHVRDFAIETLGEIDGTALFRSPNGEKAVSGLVLLLVDAKGATVNRTRTASDGSFWFERLHAGDYKITLEAGQAERLQIRLVDPHPVTITHEGGTMRQRLSVESGASAAP